MIGGPKYIAGDVVGDGGLGVGSPEGGASSRGLFHIFYLTVP